MGVEEFHSACKIDKMKLSVVVAWLDSIEFLNYISLFLYFPLFNMTVINMWTKLHNEQTVGFFHQFQGENWIEFLRGIEKSKIFKLVGWGNCGVWLSWPTLLMADVDVHVAAGRRGTGRRMPAVGNNVSYGFLETRSLCCLVTFLLVRLLTWRFQSSREFSI